MHTRRRDLKKLLHICFSRSATVHDAVLMDIGQELALSFCVGWFHKVILPVNVSYRRPLLFFSLLASSIL
jgi:hypothetical protein